MTLRDRMREHAKRTLTRTDHLGELLTYHPKGGTDRQIQAVVRRLGTEPAESGAVAKRVAEVAIPNDPDVGVTSVDKAGDRITLAIEEGDEPVSARVRSIVSQDAGMIIVEVVA